MWASWAWTAGTWRVEGAGWSDCRRCASVELTGDGVRVSERAVRLAMATRRRWDGRMCVVTPAWGREVVKVDVLVVFTTS